MARIAFGLVGCLLFALSGCSSAESMAVQVSFTGVAYDTVKDPKVEGAYRTRSAFDEKHEAQSEQIKAQTLLNGVQVVQQAGYDYVAWSGPYPATLASTTKSHGVPISTSVYRGYDYIVRGWKSAEGDARPGARPVSVALAELKGQAEQAGAAVASTTSSVATASASHLNWPMRGKVTVKFGEPINGKTNRGIMIQADEGTIVQAADAGSVDVVGPAALSIVHSGGYNTVYACLNSVVVKQGNLVTAGQPIGKVGKTGTCRDMPDPILAFFVRRNRQAIDPMSLLPAQ
jgi:murein DD-endopeptidase MepM/ murein hydrolase activator NlpD